MSFIGTNITYDELGLEEDYEEAFTHLYDSHDIKNKDVKEITIDLYRTLKS